MKIKILGIEEVRIISALKVITSNYFNDFEFVDNHEDITITFFQEKNFYALYNGKKYTFDNTELNKKDYITHLYTKIMTDITGVVQKWGLHTGVKPTKLVHKYLKQGKSREEIIDILKKSYLITDEKISLLFDIIDQQLKIVPNLYNMYKEVSIYIGIPYCPTRCAYCSFPSYPKDYKHVSINNYLKVLKEEIKQIGQYLFNKGIKISTIYIGGGTPTSLSANEIDDLLCHVYNCFGSNIQEITVEAGRPDSITKEKNSILIKHSVDRISINPQTFNENTLNKIGRKHTAKETIEKYLLANSMGINNINMDIILGLPDEFIDEVNNTLNILEMLKPKSITVHTLAVKNASIIKENKTGYNMPLRTEMNKLMDHVKDFVGEKDYKPYYMYRQKNILGNLENVGYAKDNYSCLYNILMMEEVQNIIGIGVGASSKYLNAKSVRNPRDIIIYCKNYQEYIDKKIEKLEIFLKEMR